MSAKRHSSQADRIEITCRYQDRRDANRDGTWRGLVLATIVGAVTIALAITGNGSLISQLIPLAAMLMISTRLEVRLSVKRQTGKQTNLPD